MIKSIILFFFGLADSVHNCLFLKIKRVKHSKDLKVNGKLCIIGQGNIVIGNDVKINSKLLANPIGGDTRTILNTSSNGNISIGDGSGLSNCTIVSRQSVSIGKNVKIGGSCRIYDTDFHSISYEDRIENGDKNVKCAPVVVDDGAFIGAFSIILKGVTVGKHCVIGAGSVVTKDVPDGEIWAGNPAKFIKKAE